jgi:hypothetical protein
MRVQSNTGVERFVDGVTLVEIQHSSADNNDDGVNSAGGASAAAAAAAGSTESSTQPSSARERAVVCDDDVDDVDDEHDDQHARDGHTGPQTGRGSSHQRDGNGPTDVCHDELDHDSNFAVGDDSGTSVVRSSHHPFAQHCSDRATVFGAWLESPAFQLRTLLGEGASVLDVAGGKGELTLTLTMAGVRAVLVDPRQGKLSRRQRKALRRSDREPFECVHAMFGGTSQEDIERKSRRVCVCARVVCDCLQRECGQMALFLCHVCLCACGVPVLKT